MTVFRRTPLVVAVAGWLIAHVVFAVLTLPDVERPAVDVIAVGIGVSACVVTLVPLLDGRAALGRTAAVGVAALAVVSAVLNSLSVGADQVATYALWWPGLVVPVIAGLVLRRRPWHGAVTAVVLAAVLALTTAAALPDSWVSPTLVLGSYLPMWWVGGWLVGRFVDASAAAIARERRVLADARRREVLVGQRRTQREARQALVDREVVPVLSCVASGAPVDEQLVARSRRVEADLRFELSGRELIDDQVRAAADLARSRGVTVSIVDDGTVRSTVRAMSDARELVAASIGGCLDGSVTARRSPGAGVPLTVVHVGSQGSLDAVVQATRRWTSHRATYVLERDDDALVIDAVVPPSR